MNDTCRSHDIDKEEVEMAFYPIYLVMFIVSVFLNSALLYIVMNKKSFVQERRSFQKLFICLIFFDLAISILILPNVLIKMFTKDTDTHVLLDGFLAIRDFSITAQMIILVLIAIDRMLVFVIPLSTIWKVKTVMMILKGVLVSVCSLYIIRWVLLSVNIPCLKKRLIDKVAKSIIGVSGGFFMMLNLLIYIVLFTLLCRRQFIRQKHSYTSQKFYRAMQSKSVDEDNSDEKKQVDLNIITLNKTESNKKTNSNRLSMSRRIGSIKFVKVLLGVNVIMIVSYLPAVLYTAKMISFPSFSVFYLFYFHALGDPILFFMTRPELKKNLISLFTRR